MAIEQAAAPQATAGGAAGVVEIEYFTDPLCSWSWALEPQWRRLRYESGAQLRYRYRMGGMIADWQSYSDPLNAVSRPLQMGPLWFQVRHVSGMPVDDRIWLEDPPASSYPASIAVKAAERQSADAGERYLRRLREAVMLERRNIARRDVLLALGQEVARETNPVLDFERFAEEIDGPEAVEAFRQDLMLARYRDIGRFPTLILRGAETALCLIGYRPYAALRAALEHVQPDLVPLRRGLDRASYGAYWGRITERELAEIEEEVATTESLEGEGICKQLADSPSPRPTERRVISCEGEASIQ